MKIGIGLPNQVPNVQPTVIPTWAATAEKAGFSSLCTVGRFAYPGVMDTVALAAAAGATSTIGLVSGIMIVTSWPAPLLAKEVAGIDGVSGGRLTLGVGVGVRPDDFVAEGYGAEGRGKRFDRDLETYRQVWQRGPVGGGDTAAVPEGTREVPLLFGARAPVALNRMARWGAGFIGGAIPPEMVAPDFEAAREAWRNAGRAGSPYLLGLAYFGLSAPDKSRVNLYDYYAASGDRANMIVDGMRTSSAAVSELVGKYQDLGVDELVFLTGHDDVNEVSRLAEAVL